MTTRWISRHNAQGPRVRVGGGAAPVLPSYIVIVRRHNNPCGRDRGPDLV